MNTRHSIFCRMLAGILLLCNVFAVWAEDIDIIPRPLTVEQSSGHFTLTPKTNIGYDATCRAQAEYLRDMIYQSTGWDLPMKENARKATIRLFIDSAAMNKAESYRLEVGQKSVTICGADCGGVFYGIQSLLQLFPSQIYSDRPQRDIAWTASAVTIEDAPERPWRGMMLDVARYFHDKEFVKKYIDMMAMYKLNKLQFHFIDDSGWRLEIKKYPRLTEVGAWAGPDHNRLGGYYTQDDIREIIAYGEVRNVEIIPEIEFPAHILSAVVAYPWLSCMGLQHKMPTQHFISRDLLCVGKESSLKFLCDVLEETIELFPSHYINIGGDEAVYTVWEHCPDCQALMKREGLTKVSELQGYLTNYVADFLRKKNRTAIGWEEIIMRGKVETPVVALIWHNVNDSIHATQTGHKAILTPAIQMYLDFPEGSTPGEVKAATWCPPISLEKCYTMEVNDFSANSTVIGVQGCLWSDQFIHGTQLQEIPYLNENRAENYVEYLTFPRLLAVAEVAWSPSAKRDFRNFSRRLTLHYQRLGSKGCNYRVPEPRIESMEKTADGRLKFTLSPTVEGADILYTTDGSYPTIHSPRYTGPVIVDNKSDFHAITVVTPRHYSLPIYFAPDYSAYAKYGDFIAEWEPLNVQPRMVPWTLDCTGKISGNGLYEVTFVQTKGTNSFSTGTLKLYKRKELLAEVQQSAILNAASPTVTYSFRVDAFEAGTPFYIQIDACGEGGNDTSGLVFVRKAQAL